MEVTRRSMESFGSTALVVYLGLASAIFWMVVAWRAMRAHERIATAAERVATERASGDRDS